jgi:hypothetical protein
LPEYILLPWTTRFEDPIALPDGRQLFTLKDAADYITKLPREQSDLAQWQAAIEALMLCSRGGDIMLARIAFMKALNRNVMLAFNPDAKKHHWGKRKLKREE